MGWMSDLAGETPLKGQVVVTRSTGVSTSFRDLGAAEDACGDLKGKLTYFRGAFFEKGTSRRADAAEKEKAKEKAKPEKPTETPVPAPAKRRKSSAIEESHP